MWALCPPYHDNDMPIDLRKRVVLERDLAKREEYYHAQEDDCAPKDYSIKEANGGWQQQNILPVRSLYPFMAEKYGAGCSVVPEEDEKPHDRRPTIKGTLETAIKKLHCTKKLKLAQNGDKEQRCKSTDAVSGKGNGLQRSSRSNSCPDLTCVKQESASAPHTPTPPTNGAVATEIQNYPQYNGYSPDRAPSPSSPIVGGAKKRKSFVPIYGDRAPVYDPGYRSPSPQNLVYSERVYRTPSPKRPLYIHRPYHSPSPEHRVYSERVYRSPSPKRPVYSERHYYSQSPTRPAYDERRFHSPSPLRPSFEERGFRSPSPVRRPNSPPEHPPYEEYFSHPEVLLRRQLGHQNASPYFLHVYDYYQHLVQRLRQQSSPTLRISSPVSPSPIEEDSNPDAQRKRPCRALTGKHVRQGTGASLSTLLTLRQKIQERQKAKEHQPRSALNGINNKNVSVRKVPPKKAKLNGKSPLSKIHNC